MECFCCDQEMTVARKVKIRRWCQFSPALYVLRPAGYQAYNEQMTYRWGVICEECYCILDNCVGVAEIRGQTFSLAGASLLGRARSINEDQYQMWQRREAAKLGVEIPA
jgi:hypothetical protein